jgi:hypothetical protein
MYYSYVEIEYVATSFSPARTDLAVKISISVLLCICIKNTVFVCLYTDTNYKMTIDLFVYL